jgi:hypothetical protein
MKRTHQFSLHHLLYFMLVIALSVTACKKGDPGPKGDKGDTGANGNAGGKGDKGDKGDAGTANVSYSAWLDLTFAEDTTTGGFSKLITEPKITEDILSKGDVKVYWNFGTATDKFIVPLPFRGAFSIQSFYTVGKIELDASADVSTFIDGSNNKRFQYRYVIIPGGTALRTSTKIDWNNYEEVKTYLGLKD